MTVRRAPIRRADLDRIAGPPISRDAPRKPELRPLRHEDRTWLVKDYGRRSPLVRALLGRFAIRREALAYEALAGLPGVPLFLGRIDAHALVVERIEGADARTVPEGGYPAEFFDRLYEVVAGIHGRGIVHGDLRQRRNVIVGPAGRPYVVDFASAIRLPRGSALLRLLARLDLSGVAKLKARYAPELVDDRDRRLLAGHAWRPFRNARLRRRAARR